MRERDMASYQRLILIDYFCGSHTVTTLLRVLDQKALMARNLMLGRGLNTPSAVLYPQRNWR